MAGDGMIRAFIRYIRDRHFRRATKQLRAHVTATNARDGEKSAWVAEIEARLAARKLLRPDRQKAARKGVETKRRAA
jgi:hypothetical protein